jgi:hypothetical protein
MVIVPKSDWKRTKNIETGIIGAWIRCPGCKKVAPLDHEIAKDGSVTPSVVCPHEGCSFHDFIKLEDWPDGGRF